MKKHLYTISRTGTAFILAVAMSVSAPISTQVAAHGGHDDTSSSNTATKRSDCSGKQAAAMAILERIIATRESHITHITEISDKVTTFYTKNKLALENYGTLTTQNKYARAAALAALANMKAKADVDCNSPDLKAHIKEFKTARTELLQAISTYKETVRAFVEAVKTASKSEAQK